MVRRRRGRKRALGTCAPMELPHALNQRWSLDFVSDTLADGRRLRILCVIDDFSRVSGHRGRYLVERCARGARVRTAHTRASHPKGDRQRE